MIGSIISGVTALGNAIYGTVKSAQANKKATDLINSQRKSNQDWYNTKMSEDYTQRSDAQAVISKQRELLNEQYRNAKATNLVAGGTDESLALQQQSANKALAQTMTDIASEASAYKDNIEQQYRAQDSALAQQQIAGYQQQAADAANAASQAVNSGLSGLGNGIVNSATKKINA